MVKSLGNFTKRGTMDTPVMRMPKTRTFSEPVAKPTIKVVTVTPHELPRPVVQWYGTTDSQSFEEFQFHFPLPAQADDPIWMAHPEKFDVIFLGQVKDWPEHENAASMIHSYGANTWVIWIAAAFYPPDEPQQRFAPMFILLLNVILADGTYGIISPRTYANLGAIPGNTAMRARAV